MVIDGQSYPRTRTGPEGIAGVRVGG